MRLPACKGDNKRINKNARECEHFLFFNQLSYYVRRDDKSRRGRHKGGRCGDGLAVLGDGRADGLFGRIENGEVIYSARLELATHDSREGADRRLRNVCDLELGRIELVARSETSDEGNTESLCSYGEL